MEHILTKSKVIENNVNKAYEEAIKKPEFKAIVKKANISDEDIKKNVTKLEDTLNELKNCQNCKGLFMCKNSYEGHIIFPETRENKLVFSYTPCRFQKKAIEAQENKDTGEKEIKNALDDAKCEEYWIEHFRRNKKIKSLSRDVIEELIDCIYVHEGGNITVKFKYQDEYERVLNGINNEKEETI